MSENNENDTTRKSEINAIVAFTQSLASILKKIASALMICKNDK